MPKNDNFRKVRTAEGGVLRLAKADLPSGGGASLRYATVVVAAADSLHPEDADVVCTGVDDDLTIGQVIEDQWDEDASEYTGPTPRIVLMEGTYMFDAGLTIARDGVTIEGQGAGTVLRCVNPTSDSVVVSASAVSLSNLMFVDDMMASRVAGDLSFGGTFVRGDSYSDLSVSGCVFACSDLDSVIVAGERSRITDNVVCGVEGLVPARGWSGGASSGLSVLDGSVVSGNMLRVEMPPGAPVIRGVTLDGKGIVFADNFVYAEFPSRSDTEVYSGDVLYATTVWAGGDAITITGNYLYGWFEPFDGWVSFEDTTVIYADYGDGGLVSGNVCDGNVYAGNSYYDTIVLDGGTDGWQVTSNNLSPEYNNGAGTVVENGYDSMVSLNNPNW